MAFSEVLQRFVSESSWCVMARGLLEPAFAPQKMNALFDANAQAQQTRTLLFSSLRRDHVLGRLPRPPPGQRRL